jgi:hypothetical protein
MSSNEVNKPNSLFMLNDSLGIQVIQKNQVEILNVEQNIVLELQEDHKPLQDKKRVEKEALAWRH